MTDVGQAPDQDMPTRGGLELWEMPVLQTLPASAVGTQGSESPAAAVARMSRDIRALSERIDEVNRGLRPARLRRDRDAVRALTEERAELVDRRDALRERNLGLIGH